MQPTLRAQLAPLLDGRVTDDEATRRHYSRDASLFEVTPQLVVYPKNTADLSRLVQFASAHAQADVSLTARAGGTDMSGGPLNDSIIVDMTAHLNRIKSITEHTATVEPGVYYRDFEAAAAQHKLLLPSYPASRGLCTVGGMVANNAGGEKTLMYGQTGQYVTRLKAVLRDSQEHTLAPLSQAALHRATAKPGLLPRLLDELFTLLNQHYERLQRAKPKVSKNAAGYALWDVWNRQTGIFDPTKLFVGSQGTLGLITEITFRLITPRPHRQMLVTFLFDLHDLADIVQHVLRYQPESLESYDDHTFKIALRYLPDLLKQMRGGLFSLAWQFLPEGLMVARGGIPKLILLAEFSGEDPREVVLRTQAAQKAIQRFGVKSRVTASRREMAKYWAVRRESFNLLRRHVRGKRTAPFIDDIIVRPDQLTEFLPRLTSIMEQYDLTYTVAGHAGNANFHIIPLMDVTRPDLGKVIGELSEKVYDLVIAYGGSITAEHNDGLIRTPYLERMYGQEVMQLFARVKKLFDPHNIFNPGKKVWSSKEFARQHLIHKN